MTLANWLSIFRILITPFFVTALIYYNPQRDYLRWVALAVFCLASLSDVADGFVARKLKQNTTFGSIIDPLADKILLIAGFITLAALEVSPLQFRLPTWIPIIVISRDAIILLGVFLIYTLRKEFEVLPTRLGKITTFFQTLTIIAVIIQLEFAPFIWTSAAVFTIASGIQYITKGIKVLSESE